MFTALCIVRNWWKPCFYYARGFASKPQKKVVINFLWKNGKKKAVNANIGDTLLDVVLDNNVDIDGFGACEGTLACSTCHLIFSEKDFQMLTKPMSEEEEDMLDLAFGVTKTSRLGCQVIVTENMNDIEIVVPEQMFDARSQ
ncbi:Adrenodoxin mitochondrial [Fasciolopsis buskii]|uniref:Adrenodoxin mitochondrial n=1 Tax=Fasciolopsis buskii TaxID=27845 RepID=A0A8E0VJW6_9TREM|nr:Adrenodoxin mitochondrial [Fasciolopsis buski]